MVHKTGGLRRKSRYKLTKEKRQHGKISVSRYFQSFEKGDRVYLDAEPAVQKGFYHPHFMGKIGTIKAKRGKCYEITINDIGKDKVLVVHPVHLKRAQ